MPNVRDIPALLVAALTSVSCAGGAVPGATPAASVVERPLAGLAAQRIIVAPVPAVREGDAMGWAAGIPRQRDWLRTLDQAITAELGARGLESAWVYPDALLRSYERNPAMSPNPYRLTSESLRAVSRLTGEERIPEPLASQLRTLVALHDGRYVLLPLEVWFSPEAAGAGRARLRLMLVDARSTEVRWLGEVNSDPSSALNPGVTASLAARLGDLIAAP